MTHCPLCHNPVPNTVERISPGALTDLYQRSLSIDITSLVSTLPEISFCRCPQCDLLFFLPAIAGDAEFYRHLQHFDWYYLDEKYEFHISSQYINASDRILEIGCGGGALMEALDHPPHYHGLDINLPASRQEDKRFFSHRLEDHTQHYHEYYDIVCAFHVLEHIPDVHEFIQNALDALKKGGRLIFSTPSEESFLKSAVNNPLNMPPHHLTRWSDAALRSIAATFHLKEVALYHEPLPEYHKVWAAKTVIIQAVHEFFKTRPRLINRSAAYLIMSFLSTHLSRLFHDRILKNQPIAGQTAYIVFEK